MATAVSALSSLSASDSQQASQGTPAATPANSQPAEPTATAAPEDIVTLSANSTNTTEPIYTQIQSLVDQGETVQQIAEQLGMSPQAVQSYIG